MVLFPTLQGRIWDVIFEKNQVKLSLENPNSIL